jgi:diguanylate cyclase (GGDEF)-like protein/PAS domain S-box-containing protein
LSPERSSSETGPPLTLADLVQRDLVRCDPELSLGEAARAMRRAGVSSVLVEDPNGQPLGIWTERDILRLDLSDPAKHRQPLRTQMSTPVRGLGAQGSPAEALELMQREGFRHLLVLDDEGGALGLVSLGDLVRQQGPEAYLQLREVHSAASTSYPSLAASDRLSAAARAMAAQDRSAAIVTFAEEPPGLVTERDVARYFAEGSGDPELGGVASRPLVRIGADETLLAARRTMLENGIRHLGVNGKDGGVMGLLEFADLRSSSDTEVVRELVASLETARRQERRFQEIQETAPVGLMELAPDLIVRSANPAAQQLLASDTTALPGTRFCDRLASDSPLHTELTAMGRGDRDVLRREERLLGDDGRWHWAEVTASLLRSETGLPQAISAVLNDIGERKEMEARLRQERDFSEHILNALPGLFYLLDESGGLILWNRNFERTLGYGPDELAGMHPTQFVREGDRERAVQALGQVMETGEVQMEIDLYTRSGRPRPLYMTAYRLDLGDRQYVAGMGIDISERKALEERLQRRQSALESLQEIAGSPSTELPRKIDHLLALGCRLFGFRVGLLVRIDPQGLIVEHSTHPEGSLTPGGPPVPVSPLEEALPDARTPLTDPEAAGLSTPFHHPLLGKDIEGFAAVGVDLGEGQRGALLYLEPLRPGRAVSDFNRQLLRIMGQWMGYELTREANRRALERERNLFVGGPTVVFQWSTDDQRTVTYVSPNVEADFGYRPADLIGRSFIDLVHPEDRERILNEISAFIRQGVSSYEQEYRLRAGDGDYRWVYDFSVLNRDEAGQIRDLQGYLLDISRRQELEAEQRLLATAFHTSQALVITDAEGTIERVNAAFTTITGYSPEEAIGQNPRMLASGVHDSAFYQAMWQALTEEGHWEGEVWNQRKNGEIFPEWESITAVPDAEGNIRNYVAVFHDISEQKRLEAELERLATHDRLTGIYNRAKLYELLELAQAEHQRYGTPFSVVMLDLDHFKAINDRYGHHQGDAALQEITRRMGTVLRETDHLGRWGGEEFLILATRTHQEGAARLAERIRQQVRSEPFAGIGAVTVSLGVAEIAPGETLEHLEERADRALYAAKDRGRDTVELAPSDGSD